MASKSQQNEPVKWCLLVPALFWLVRTVCGLNTVSLNGQQLVRARQSIICTFKINKSRFWLLPLKISLQFTIGPSFSNHTATLFKVQWVVPKWLCLPPLPAWKRPSQTAANTVYLLSKSPQESRKINQNPLRLHPEERMVALILWLLVPSPSTLPSQRRSQHSLWFVKLKEVSVHTKSAYWKIHEKRKKIK